MDICVYGASGDRLKREFFEAAEELGCLLAQKGHRLIFGGGNGGLMGACARGVHSQGGKITGIAPKFFDEPDILFPYCDSFIYTETLRERKQLMEDNAEAFIVLPGGIGTFEEFFETLTLKQLGRHAKPIALLNTLGYYDELLSLLHHAVDGGFLSGECLSLFALCQSPEEALAHSETTEELRGGIQRLQDYTK